MCETYGGCPFSLEMTHLLFIQQKNRLALNSEEPEQSEYHGQCRATISLYLNDRRVPETSAKKMIRKLFEDGTGVGCQQCKDTGEYVEAATSGDVEKMKELEERYGITAA